MLRLAFRNLTQNKTRLLISVGGVGLALTLVLFLDAVLVGATSRMTSYIDHAGADVWVSQEGVTNMHMSNSALGATKTDEVKQVPGVEEAVPILYSTEFFQVGEKQYSAYVIGVPTGAPYGGPWSVVDGSSHLAAGEIIIDRAVANSGGLHLGDQITVLGQKLRISGLITGTSSLTNSVSFITMDDFARNRGGGTVISFVLVKVKQGQNAREVASRIGTSLSGVTVQTRTEFAAQEAKLAKDMTGDLINIMNNAGYLTGLAVVALTVYIATIGRRREYGVLKAMGVRNSRLYEMVLAQALMSVAIGLAAGIFITLLLSLVIPRFDESLALSVAVSSVLKVVLVSVVIAGIAALLPSRQIAGLEPSAVLRRS